MALFDHLHEDAFLIFSRKNRRLYAEAVLALYRGFFGGTQILVPTRDDVVAALQRLLRERPELWAEPEEIEAAPVRGPETQQAYYVYGRLVACGWLEEEPYGFNAVVDMPPTAMVLAEQFDMIERGLGQVIGGAVVEIRAALRAVKTDPSANALGLAEAADHGARLVRRLRAILSSLRAVRRAIMTSGDLKSRVHGFFAEFIERILIRDYQAMFSYAQHPLRFRAEVADMAAEIQADASHIRDLTDAYVQNGLAASPGAAEGRVREQLQMIEEVFRNLRGFIDRIEEFRIALERRLVNTVRYLDRVDTGATSRIIGLMVRLDALRDRRAEDEIPSALTPRTRPFAWQGLAEPRTTRQPVQRQPLETTRPDPVELFRERLVDLFEARLEPEDETVAAFLDRFVPPGGATEACWIGLASLDDYAAFERALEAAAAGEGLDGRYTLALAPGRHDSDWTAAPNFRIARREE